MLLGINTSASFSPFYRQRFIG